jgi:hypothetical protein
MWRSEECTPPWNPSQYSLDLAGHYRAALDFTDMFLQVQSKLHAKALEPWAAYATSQVTTCASNRQLFDLDLKWKAPQVCPKCCPDAE